MIKWLLRLFHPAQGQNVSVAKEPSLDQRIASPSHTKTVSRRHKSGSGEFDAKKAVLSGTAPEGLRVRSLDLSSVDKPFVLPQGLRCSSLNVSKSAIRELPESVHVDFRIDLAECVEISALPPGLKTGSLILSRCTKIQALPEEMNVNFLNIEECTSLEEWPESARVSLGAVNARGCTALKSLPRNLGPLTNLDLNGCRKLDTLPATLELSGWLDIAGTTIQGLPESLQGVQLRWRGVNIDAQIAFFPETLTASQILSQRNAEVRRVMMERCGLEKFVKEAKAKVLDADTDAGGQRQLLRIPLEGDEDLVCVSIHCPSTGRHYIVRVPPGTLTCRQAVAWTAGYDDPRDYNPLVET